MKYIINVRPDDTKYTDSKIYIYGSGKTTIMSFMARKFYSKERAQEEIGKISGSRGWKSECFRIIETN